MSFETVIKNIENLKGVISEKKFVEQATRDAMSEMVVRIFEKGEDSNNGSIGSYSTRPINIPIDQSPRKGIGQRKGNSLFFQGGYRQFKKELGLGENVNLRVFNELLKDFSNANVNSPGDVNPTILDDLTALIVLKKNENKFKRQSLEAKFGKTIFEATQKEQEIFANTLTNLILNELP